jgi:hypothetical protein
MAATRLSRLQQSSLRWLATEEQRTGGGVSSCHQELVGTLSSAKGNISHSVQRDKTIHNVYCERLTSRGCPMVRHDAARAGLKWDDREPPRLWSPGKCEGPRQVLRPSGLHLAARSKACKINGYP